MTKFEELKNELIEMVKPFEPCLSEYKKLLSSTTESELLKVIYDNLLWCSERKFLTSAYFEKFDREIFINSGIANTGLECTGFSNSGNWNSGYSNSGNWNSGYSNSGDRNSGDSNSGYRNSGDSNSGDSNSGDSNSGDSNSGNWNSGYSNSGDRNSGNSNSGYRNSGNWNSGNSNSGDSNSGYRNSGAFCIDTNPKIYLFDSPTDIYVKDWEQSKVYQLMSNGLNFNFWIYSSEMNEQEKLQYPKHETTDGYLKKISHEEGWGNFWGNLSDKDKKEFTSLPNFDAGKFFQITGIKL